MNLLPLVIGAGIYFASRGSRIVNASNTFQYSILDLPAAQIQGGKVVLQIPIGVSNITGESFNVVKVYGQLFVNSGYVGDFTGQQTNFRIAANGNTTVTGILDLFLTNAVASLIGALTKKAGDTTITLKGTIVTSVVDVPLFVTKKI